MAALRPRSIVIISGLLAAAVLALLPWQEIISRFSPERYLSGHWAMQIVDDADDEAIARALQVLRSRVSRASAPEPDLDLIESIVSVSFEEDGALQVGDFVTNGSEARGTYRYEDGYLHVSHGPWDSDEYLFGSSGSASYRIVLLGVNAMLLSGSITVVGSGNGVEEPHTVLLVRW